MATIIEWLSGLARAQEAAAGVDGRSRPPTLNGHRGPTVRLIAPENQPERGPDGRFGPGHASEVKAATEHLTVCRAEAASARAALEEAKRTAAETQREALDAQRQYQQAREQARAAEVALHQQQRKTSDAKLALRRALEWLARLEGTNGVSVGDAAG